MGDLSQPELWNEAVEGPGAKEPWRESSVAIGSQDNSEKSDGVTLGFLVQNLGKVSPEVLEQPDEGEREAESKVLARLGKAA